MFGRFIFFLIFSLSIEVSANETDTNWVIVTGSDFPPYTDLDYPEGGLLIKLFHIVMEELPGNYEIKWLPWRRGYLETIEGTYVGTFPYVHTPERARHLLYSEAIIGVEERFFSRANESRDFNNIENYKNIVTCKPVGYNLNAIQPFVDKGHISLRWADNLDTCFLQLSQGRVDLVDMDKYVGFASIKKAGLKPMNFKMHERILLTQSMHLLVSKKHPRGKEFLDAFNKALLTVRESKVYRDLLNEYLR
ncbi:substrate-binding periplasmic protein [Litoribrevibacter albus]|uniref:Transporter substrate-binding domain-containing protein n=1 Tax=Litoribrevibacter albus TaxID=1473156 RepID=A0AA37W714_9GAMM|nr:transporter substrate-binding domain-containing protein [Litoribrevibacter albus]GLQ30146.1 hypothetical protein GCM10007876_06240 [Litoribrevibacter albus]